MREQERKRRTRYGQPVRRAHQGRYHIIKLDNGSAFGIAFSFFELPENASSDIPFTGESEEELDSPIPEEDAPDSDFKEDDADEE